MNLSDSSIGGIFALFGVFLGFLLPIFWEKWKERTRRNQLLNQINEELQANRYMLFQKRDIIRKIIDQLGQKQILSGVSVSFITNYYESFIHEVSPHLDIIEKNSLHVIYQSLKTIDETLYRFEQEITMHLSIKTMNEPYKFYIGRMQDLLDRINVVSQLIGEHLQKKPIDVFYVKGQQKTKIWV